MRRDVGLSELFNLVMMTRTRSQRSVVLTESDLDTDLYRKFFSEPQCLVRSASNRDGVLAALERFSQYKVKGCVGIIDADCDHVVGRPSPRPDVCVTDGTDKETTIINSAAFHDFCFVLGALVPSSQLRDVVFEAAFPIGAIRRVSVREGLALDFKRVRVASFIEAGPKCDILKCCTEVATLNPQASLSTDDLAEFVRDKPVLSLPRACVVRGHDVISILELQSESIFGRYVSQRELEFELARAFLFEHFRNTKLYDALRAWEQTVLPTYRLFPSVS